MTETPVITVVVAVFQVERFIRRCLDSLRAQTFPFFEVILVDDGSIDDSGCICDEYVEADPRFRVIHTKHAGVGSARQIGLDAARGEYVIHADPDDWVESDWLQALSEKIIEEKADMVICDFEQVYADHNIYRTQKPSSLDNSDIVKDLLEEKLSGSCCNKLIRKSCLSRNNITFNPRMTFMEDLYVVCMLLRFDIKVCYLSKMLYHYCNNGNRISLSTFINDKSISSLKFFIDFFSPVFTDARYNPGWYYRKSVLKEHIFRANGDTAAIRTVFPEINKQYIQESRHTRPWSIKRCVALCLRGHPHIAHLLYRIILKIRQLRK